MVWLKATQVERIKRIWDGFFLGEWMDGPLKRKGMGTDFLEGVLDLWCFFLLGRIIFNFF